jgi:hypothetical protein
MEKTACAIIAALALSGPVRAQAVDAGMDFEPEKDTAQEIWKYQTEKFDAMLSELKSHEYFAGTLVSIQFRGESFTVDRRMETPKRTPGNPPPRLETLGSLLGGLSASTRGQLKINVQRTFDENGIVKSESWTIEVGGSWEAQTGMQDETGKQHK